MGTAFRHIGPLVLAMTAGAATLARGGPLPQPQQTQEPPPRIKVTVDVVAVDVQVIDRTGRPVPNLGPEKFTVTINGRQRRIVSAEQIVTDAPEGDGPSAAPAGSAAAAVPARVIVI